MIRALLGRLLGLAILVGVPAVGLVLLGRQAMGIESGARPRLSGTAHSANDAKEATSPRPAGDVLDMTTWEDTGIGTPFRR